MKKLVLISALLFPAIFNNAYAEGASKFCQKIAEHAHSIMVSRVEGKTQTQLQKIFDESRLRPYQSAETRKWLKISINDAYKSKWNSYSTSKDGNLKFYAGEEFKQEIYVKCMKTAPSNATYCSTEVLNANLDNSRRSYYYRAQINSTCDH